MIPKAGHYAGLVIGDPLFPTHHYQPIVNSAYSSSWIVNFIVGADNDHIVSGMSPWPTVFGAPRTGTTHMESVMSIAPVWFISHGAPDLVLRDQPATHFLKNLRLGDLKGLVVISAHWFTRSELQINVEPNPALMYDFYGFPEPLYHIRWPANSPLWLQEAVSDQLLLAGLPAEPVRRELDHGVWSPLSLMDPASSVPLVQLSIPASFTPRQLWQLGRRCSSCAPRDRHPGLRRHHPQPAGTGAGELAGAGLGPQLRQLAGADHERGRPGGAGRLPGTGAGAVESHPHDDHLRPLFVALGAAGQDKPVKLHDSWDGGSLYMGSYRFG